jgi:hypothetical protein
MGHLLNPVLRSIAPKNNRPKNPPVHGLNVFAFARIQTSSKCESLRGVKAAARRLRGGLRASLDPSTLKAAAQDVSPNRQKSREL